MPQSRCSTILVSHRASVLLRLYTQPNLGNNSLFSITVVLTYKLSEKSQSMVTNKMNLFHSVQWLEDTFRFCASLIHPYHHLLNAQRAGQGWTYIYSTGQMVLGMDPQRGVVFWVLHGLHHSLSPSPGILTLLSILPV